MATLFNKMLNSGLTAFNTVKKGGTPSQALTSANAIMQGKGPIATPKKTTSISSTNPVMNLINTMSNPTLNNLNNVTQIPKAIQTPTPITPSQALAQGNGPIASTVAQPIAQTMQPVQPQVDANLATQIQDLVKVLQQNNQPKAIPQYQSQYNDDIAGLINQFNNRPKFAFDATNNPTIQAYQNKATNAINQEMGRRNMLDSTVEDKRKAEAIAEVFATVAPQLEQQAFNQDQAERENILQQIQNYQNLDNNDYSRFVNSYNIGQDATQNQFNNTMSIADIINKLNVQDYNKTQDAKANARQDSELTGLYNPYAGVEVLPEAQKYSSDYSAEINRRRATPDTADDYLISQLEAAKANKVFSSPDLLNKYGDQYKTPAQRAAEYNNLIEQQKLELQADPNSLANQMKIIELNKAKTELDQLAKYGPQEQQLKLQEIKSRINENAASASASYARANQIKNEKTSSTTDGLKYKDYYEAGVEMKNAGTYDDYKNYVPRYDDQQIFTWIDGLPIPSEQKAQLARDIGVSEKVKAVEKVQGPYPNAWN